MCKSCICDLCLSSRCDLLDEWREMMCTKMQKSLSHCETPDGIMIMGNACRGKCRYSHLPLKL